MAGKWEIFIDTGGTFTDCIAHDPKGGVLKLKILSNSRLRCRILKVIDPLHIIISHHWYVSKNIFSGYTIRILNSGKENRIVDFDPENSQLTLQHPLTGFDGELEICSPEEVPLLAARMLTQTPLNSPLPSLSMRLGSTKGTNALLERKGARVAFLVTKGFKDLIKIGNQQRENLFSITINKPAPYYDIEYEVNERLNHKGEIVRPLRESELNDIIKNLKKQKIESVAVAFLHSYLNPEHEQKTEKVLTQAGFNFVSTSAALSNSIKILPRAETSVANAYLDPIIKTYIRNIKGILKSANMKVMTSTGGLIDADNFYPKDSLLSGPAGGLVGAAKMAVKSGISKILTLDMGGTSTDVARYDDGFDYRYETKVGNAKILSPALFIESIAAGGGSVCRFDGYRFTVGPESAGAEPGPACYGAGGPFTITDVNLLLGKIDPEIFGIPVNTTAAEKALDGIRNLIFRKYKQKYSREVILEGFEQIANEKMAEAIKKISTTKGYDPADYTLLAFGGAGGQHACQIADLLQVHTVLIPEDAGLLSAYGIGQAVVERFAGFQVLKPWNQVHKDVPAIVSDLEKKVTTRLENEGFRKDEIRIRNRFFYLRLYGQDHTIEVNGMENIIDDFKKAYIKLYGHWIEDREIELESVKVAACNIVENEKIEVKGLSLYSPESNKKIKSLVDGRWENVAVFHQSELRPGALITGPAIIGSRTGTTSIMKGWAAEIDIAGNTIMTKRGVITKVESEHIPKPEAAQLELFSNRFTSIAHDMGALLQRTSFSVNIKERLDFSCAILDADGYLVVNAPHIPVHLGSLGICIREIRKELSMEKGDVVITNHPRFGGSHLPDITLVSPVYFGNSLIGYVANRGHHAEVGGTRPGSMPPDAMSLEEEGVVISPIYLVKNGKTRWNEVEAVFKKARYPTRALQENLADLNGALASIRLGVAELKMLAEKYTVQQLKRYMDKIRKHAHESLMDALSVYDRKILSATEILDNGAKIVVKIKIRKEEVIIDFEGTSPQQADNLNATPAITMSAILYVLRLLSQKEIPLNEGLLKNVKINLPPCMLNPDFSGHPSECPPVVGGNTETSQRLVDTLLKAFGIAACSQGTMNNLLFGNDSFGYYETICGGVGAARNSPGADAVHQHMTNTRITDPEILEYRYPVTLDYFRIRENSGGRGKWNGGNGVIRKMTFNSPVKLTVLSQHRTNSPYGMAGGKDGKSGEQWIETSSGKKVDLKWKDQYNVKKGDSIVICTPGGGGYGHP